ncbi:hypothetical protein [Erinnyis ello granulovirus]|uniref:Uncharacterized protein n=1 Tax=Erinnyis ello granulovirus TaxID=307444 RepID=A0A097DAG0_9BBAC|nr:hypothetical protein [Erinnyis ello granulovirus]AIS92006.1 hypothetical protein [Erinnyis ello granulovirus]ARX71345.1 hypothetical protein EREL_006 [Erinnyis ello granulovirus]ARX71475.1 hypothetical protein EREL_006 [Erinnyis ello granulovirus]ARX71605.1 hypothetical protein EREL_006 [Erinnyis ello granulovirus]ARX71735.1 hypothetical protein EREL_006 [Erinnyis ello granulovirus]
MISIYYNNDLNQVFYNFNELLQLMLQFDLEKADKKTLDVECLKIVPANEQCYVTDGSNISIRLITHDECYVSFEGVLKLIDSNTFGCKLDLEYVLVVYTSKVVLNPNHKWVSLYLQRLRSRVMVSFEFYFKILELYMVANQPRVKDIGNEINKLVSRAENCKLANDFASLIECCTSFDKASALMLQHLKNE